MKNYTTQHKSILVTGATGLAGSAVIRQFIKMKYPVKALVRNRSKAATLAAYPTVNVIEGDLAKPETLSDTLSGIEAVLLISSADPQMTQTQCAFIDAAKNAGVQHIVKFSGLSAADEDSSFVFAAMHKEIEQHLEHSGMRWTHLRPGQFMTEYLREVPTILGQNALFLPFNDARLSPVDVKDIAKAAFTILTTTGHEGKIYALTGPESLSMDDVAKSIGQATSFEVKYVNISPETRNQMLLSMGVPPFFVDALAAQTRERWKGKEATVHLHAYQELGLTPTTFAEFAQRNAAAFLGETKYAGLS